MNTGTLFGQFVRVVGTDLFQVPDHFAVAVLKHVVGLEQERARTAGGVDDFQIAENFEAAAPESLILRHNAALSIFFADAKFDSEVGESLVDQFADSVLHDATGEF